MENRKEMNKRIVREFFEYGYEKKDWEHVLSIMKDDYLDHSPCHATTSRECVDVLKITAEGFSDMHVDIRDMIEEDDRVSARIFFSCMHTGPGYGIPATGNKVEFEALEVFRLEDGLIAESWGYWPNDTVRAQINAES